jgi:prenyl protein peptidase
MSIPFATFATPPLSLSSARILALSFSIVYVGSIYISARTRLAFAADVKPSQDGRQREKATNERWRDDPDVIKARLTAVGIASCICCTGVWYVLKRLGDSVSSLEY